MIAKLDVGDLFLGDLVLANLNGLARASAENIGVRFDHTAVDRNTFKCLGGGGL